MLTLLLVLAAATAAQTPLLPMPDAKEVTHTPPMEFMGFHVALTCPDAGEVLRFYQPRLEAQGYTLCGKGEVKWESAPTVTGESLSYHSLFVSDAAQKAILVSASCSLTNGRTSAAEQSVSLMLRHEVQGGCAALALPGPLRGGGGMIYITP